MLDPDETIRGICESAGFIRPVSGGMHYKASDDMNDVFGNLTASCRKKTLPRAQKDSVVKIGPVLFLWHAVLGVVMHAT